MNDLKDDRLREKNVETLKKFFFFTEEERVDRADLFTDDAVCIAGFTEPPVTNTVGKEAIRKRFKRSTKTFKNYTYTNVIINSTQDPDKFFVEEGGYGIVVNPNTKEEITPKGPNPHINIFLMEDGKIKMWREYFDQMYAMKLLGVETPEFRPFG